MQICVSGNFFAYLKSVARVYVTRYHVNVILNAGVKTSLTIAPAMPRKKYGETSFGARLTSIRQERGFTQVQLAKAAGTTQRAISYYENEAGYPPAPAVMDLARALHVSTDELLGVKPFKSEHVADDPETRRLWKRFQQISHMPERDRRAILRVLNHFAVSTGQLIQANE